MKKIATAYKTRNDKNYVMNFISKLKKTVSNTSVGAIFRVVKSWTNR